jgi:hypothetical protein
VHNAGTGVLRFLRYALRVLVSKYFGRGRRFACWRGSSALVKAAASVRQPGNCNALTTVQQGAAPDRLQLRSLRSFLAPVSALPAAGELDR